MNNDPVSSPFKLTYELTGAGWADFGTQTGTEQVTMCVSYLHDTLDQLTSAALHLVSGASLYEEVLIVDEPGAYHLALKREAATLIASLAYCKDGNPFRAFDERTHQLYQLIAFEVSAKKFAMAVLNVLFKLYKQHGLAGYKAQWKRAEFPLANYQALEAVIKVYT